MKNLRKLKNMMISIKFGEKDLHFSMKIKHKHIDVKL